MGCGDDMAEQIRPDLVRIGLEGEWTLYEFSRFGRVYTQVYALMYSLETSIADARPEIVTYAYHAFPWRGGYSAVNFYETLRNIVPPEHRPRVNSIRYASPGFIELGLVVLVATNVHRIVRAVTTS